MEQLLHKMARQLDGLDEASLAGLWDKYALIVSQFEPTRRWEEAALVFSFIQAKLWKNQLFNYQWGESLKPGGSVPFLHQSEKATKNDEKSPQEYSGSRKSKIIPFKPLGGLVSKTEPPEEK